jgi:hypothetical protein
MYWYFKAIGVFYDHLVHFVVLFFSYIRILKVHLITKYLFI